MRLSFLLVIDVYEFFHAQYAYNVVLTSVRRRFNVMDVVWILKRCRVLTGCFFMDIKKRIQFNILGVFKRDVSNFNAKVSLKSKRDSLCFLLE